MGMRDISTLYNRHTPLRFNVDYLNYIFRKAGSVAQPNPLGNIETSSPKSVCASPLTNKYAHNARPAISIIEVMIFIAVLSIAVIGTSGYRYFAAMDIRRSDNEITAGRIASQLCESWKGIGGGVSTYSPLPANDPGIGLNISAASSSLAPQTPQNFTLLTNGGHYKIVSDGRTYYATMSYYADNSNAKFQLQTLSIIVGWPVNPSNNNAPAENSFSLSELLISKIN